MNDYIIEISGNKLRLVAESEKAKNIDVMYQEDTGHPAVSGVWFPYEKATVQTYENEFKRLDIKYEVRHVQ